MVTSRIAALLNRGYPVAVEVRSDVLDARSFVHIRRLDKPGVPREELRYLNSQYSMWDYWDYEFRRMVLRTGWANDEWNYDRYLVRDEKVLTSTESAFSEVLIRWVPEPEGLRPLWESECPA
jgi:hypothetical protein